MVMEPGTLADARKAQELALCGIAGCGLTQWLAGSGLCQQHSEAVMDALVDGGTYQDAMAQVREQAARAAQEETAKAAPENPATCDHRADVLWLAHRLRISEHRVADLTRQKKHLERRLRKALRGRRKH